MRDPEAQCLVQMVQMLKGAIHIGCALGRFSQNASIERIAVIHVAPDRTEQKCQLYREESTCLEVCWGAAVKQCKQQGLDKQSFGH